MSKLLPSQQNKFYHFHHGKRDKSEELSHKRIQETSAPLPTQDTIAQQSVLVRLLTDKITLTSGHRLAKNCMNASDSVQVPSVVKLLNYIAEQYLFNCISVILYDDFYENQFHLLRALLSTYPLAFFHGKVGKQGLTDPPDSRCRNFLLLVRDLKTTQAVVGGRSTSRVIVVTQASRWRVREFLSSRLSHNLVNLLVIGKQSQSNSIKQQNIDINLYTHDLFVNGLGSSSVWILTAWRCGALTRPTVNLFPDKLRAGFMGHQFVVAAGHQPPFVVKREQFFDGQRLVTSWDGTEIRLLWLMAKVLNFSFTVEEPKDALFLPEASSAVVKELLAGRADIGVAGIYTTPSRVAVLITSSPHTQDCVTFMTLASTALPRYRAIMGPFHWTVWLALTLTYILAIFPIAFSYNHSLKHLLKDPWQVENMFWYVFGTFTNCFTFKGEWSWSKSDKAATRMLIGSYWVFSIIISACYTGCIIAFITLAVYPSYVENCYDVLDRDFRVGTLGHGGWQEWFNDSADPATTKLFEKMEYLPDLESALHNITKAYYRDYAFLGSWSLLDYIIRINYTKRSEGKRSYLHLGTDCFVPFNVVFMFPATSPHSNVMSQMLLRIIQSGLFKKLKRDMEWDLQRTSSGKLFAASSGPSLQATKAEERQLTLEDVTGMFLLLGAGFGIAAFILFIEAIAWIMKKIKRKFFPEKECYKNSALLNEHGDMTHKDKNNEQQESLIHDDTDQPGLKKRRVYSADSRFKTYEDSDDRSNDRLSYVIPMQSATSLPATYSIKLKNRRTQTPRPSYTFTVERDAEMFRDEI
ncbi:hypothetical protein L798_09600 [Zootermopsis nevadensis]|uniref:Ionotropic glutamate receptor C-terminal domain-containing protein n=2 Tax=Zootermopsis nevadensis TaxID=136037 RepID=A0A067R032_ZOONE|nr:hypothetical protein L798_09600 [Zootermopsis nevadensis]